MSLQRSMGLGNLIFYGTGTILGGQQRFETPPLSDARPVRLPGRAADVMAMVETRTRRVVLNELVTEPIDTGGDRDAAQ